MDNLIGYTNTSFSMITFFEEENEDTPIMELQGYNSAEPLGMRVPNIGEHISIGSYEHDYINDDEPVFQGYYQVVDVISSYSENKGYKNIFVQYSVILRKENE